MLPENLVRELVQDPQDLYLKYKIVPPNLAVTLNGSSLVGAADEVVSACPPLSQLTGGCNMETNMKDIMLWDLSCCLSEN